MSARDAHRRASGYSVIELLIAIALTAIVTSELLLVWTSQHQNYIQQERVSQTQQDMRLVTDVLINDLRMAGFMVPKETAAGSNDGGASGPDVLCVSDPGAFDETEYEDATERFEAAEVTTTVAGSISSVTLRNTTIDIDEDGSGDFTLGAGILISDGADVHCARITSLAGGVVGFAPATPATISMSPLSTFAVPALIYQVTGTTLTRNGLVLSNQVDDLQLEWWVDDDGDAEIDAGEFPIHDLDGEDISKMRLARIYLTTRSAVPDPTIDGQRTAAANRNAGAADKFRRRRAIADARLRNAR